MKEKLQQKLATLVSQKEQHLANDNACGGAIALIQQLILELDAEQVHPE